MTDISEEAGGDPASSPVIDRRPQETEMLRVLLEGPQPAEVVKQAGIEKVPWSEAVAAYDAEHLYKTRKAVKAKVDPPKYENELAVRTYKGANFMIGKLFSNLQDRKAITVKGPKGKQIVTITDIGRETYKKPNPKPYMSEAGGRDSKTARRHFTDDQVLAIRQRWADGESPADLAAEFRVKTHIIGDMAIGATYVNVPVIERTPEGHERAQQRATALGRESRIAAGKAMTDEMVMEIRQLWANGMAQSVLAERYDVKPNTIHAIVKGRSYKDLPVIERTPEVEAEASARARVEAVDKRERPLPESVVMDIRERWADGDIPSELALIYGLHVSTIHSITNGQNYGHLPITERSPEAEKRASVRHSRLMQRSRLMEGRRVADEFEQK